MTPDKAALISTLGIFAAFFMLVLPICCWGERACERKESSQ